MGGASPRTGEWVGGASPRTGEWVGGASPRTGEWVGGASPRTGEWVGGASPRTGEWVGGANLKTGEWVEWWCSDIHVWYCTVCHVLESALYDTPNVRIVMVFAQCMNCLICVHFRLVYILPQLKTVALCARLGECSVNMYDNEMSIFHLCSLSAGVSR